ncbi:MAG: glycogen debranching enzyme GlgX, partial [Candidatus Accumulibacter sp.]|nr:glycogen debranching enzyme GlgX [Accumulibacter sp.]
ILAYRRRLQRALLSTLFVAQGVPMLQGGDEIGRTQAGNNNAYCQDNALTWLDWSNVDRRLGEFTAGLIALRRRFGQLRRGAWLSGGEDARGARDVIWWHPDGREMETWDWQDRAALGMILAPVVEGREWMFAFFNRNAGPIDFRLPPGVWRQCCDSSDVDEAFREYAREGVCTVPGHSVVLLARAGD